jgi:hypothetical protein
MERNNEIIEKEREKRKRGIDKKKRKRGEKRKGREDRR